MLINWHQQEVLAPAKVGPEVQTLSLKTTCDNMLLLHILIMCDNTDRCDVFTRVKLIAVYREVHFDDWRQQKKLTVDLG